MTSLAENVSGFLHFRTIATVQRPKKANRDTHITVILIISSGIRKLMPNTNRDPTQKIPYNVANPFTLIPIGRLFIMPNYITFSVFHTIPFQIKLIHYLQNTTIVAKALKAIGRLSSTLITPS